MVIPIDFLLGFLTIILGIYTYYLKQMINTITEVKETTIKHEIRITNLEQKKEPS